MKKRHLNIWMDKFDQMIIRSEQFEEKYITHISPSFTVLRESQMTIPPWTEPSFWDNVRSEKFAFLLFEEIFNYLKNEMKPVEQKGKQKTPVEQPKVNVNPFMITFLHLIVSYRYEIPETVWKGAFDQLIALANPVISHTMLYLNKMLTSPEINFKTYLDSITNKYDNQLLSDTVPLFNFLSLLRFLHSAPKAFATLFIAFRSKFEGSSQQLESYCILHIFKVLITVFPGLNPHLFEPLKTSLFSFLIHPSPVSDFAADIGNILERESIFSGSAFFEMLKTISSTSMSTNGNVPFVFDQKAAILPTLLHSRQLSDMSPELAFFNFGSYYIKSKFRSSKDKRAKSILKLISHIEFTEESHTYLSQKLKLTPDIPPNEPVDSSALLPPTIPITPLKLSVAFNISPQVTSPFIDNTFLFISPTSTIMEKSLIDPIIDPKNLTEDDGLMIKQRIILSGGDFFLGNILLSLLNSYHNKANALSRFILTYYLIPLDDTDSNQIADFIAKHDPVYSRMVRRVYSIATEMCPQFNDMSNVSFPAIVDDTKYSDNHLWFTNPSPSVIMQFAVQHYLYFAQNYCDVFVWQAQLEYENQTIVVPWISSVHIGTQFCKEFAKDQNKQKPGTLVLDNSPEIKSKFTSIAIWNANPFINTRPDQNLLFIEVINEPTIVTANTQREELGEKISRTPIKNAYIQIKEKAVIPFSVMIDDRVYGPIQGLRIAPMKDLTGRSEQMTIRFATFVPFS